MVVEKGYKQTEIGIIPEDWEIKLLVNLTNLLTKQTGFDYSAHIKPSLETNRTSQNIPFIQNKDFDGHKINYETDYFIPKSVALKFPRILLNEKCLLISISGSIGNVAVFDNSQLAFIGGAVAIAKFKDKSILNWVMYYLLSPVGRNAIFNNVKSGSHQNLTLEDIRKLYIPIPKFEEQTAIANALSDMDALIAQTEKLIEKKKAIKQGVMQELLNPKEGWVTKKLGEVCEIKKGQLITDSTRVNGDIPVIAGGKTPAYYHNKSNRSGKTITISGSGASAGYVSFHDYPIFASDCSTISNSIKYNVEFIFYWLQLIQSLIFSLQTGGAQPHIHPSDLNPLEISLPPIEDQDRIAIIFRDLQSDINILETKLQKLKHQKQGMMQALLTGKIRLI